MSRYVPAVDRRGRSGSEGEGTAGAARALEVLIRPQAFAAAHDFAGAARLAAFGATLRTAVERARQAGAPDSPALRGLAAEAGAFDALQPAERRGALGRVAAHLAGLIPVPGEIADLARAARAAMRADRPSPQPSPRARGEGEVTPAERERRRKLLATRLADLPRAHPAPRAQLEERGRATVEEALEFWPKAWQDRTRVSRIRDLRPGGEGIALATVKGVRHQRMRSGRPLLKVAVADETGALDLVFFNPAPWRARQFQEGGSILCSG